MAKKKKVKKKKAVKKKVQKNAPPYSPDDGITQSILTNWMACRQRAEHHLNGWRAPGESSALRFGSLFHWILQELYDAVRNDSGIVFANKKTPSDEVLRKFFDSCAKKWMKHIEKNSSGADALQQAEDDLAMASAIFPAYCRTYPEDFNQKRWMDVEGSFDTLWKGYRLRGKIDGVMKIRNSYWLLETKTKSRIEEDTITTALTFDFQNLFYLIGAEAGLGGKKIKGVLYNVVRRPGQRQGKKETFDDLIRRIYADVEERPDHYFKRYEINYDEDDRKRFAQELIWKLDEFLSWRLGEIPTYRNEMSCTSKWNCTYLDACSANKMTGYVKNGRPFAELEV